MICAATLASLTWQGRTPQGLGSHVSRKASVSGWDRRGGERGRGGGAPAPQTLPPGGGRVHTPVPVSIEKRMDGSARGQTVDLSAFAAKVATDLALQPGDLVTLSLTPAAPGTTLTLPAVVWDVGSTGAVLPTS